MADFPLGIYNETQGVGAMYNGVAVLVDGATPANTYIAFGNSDAANTNITWIDVFKYSANGALVEHQRGTPTPPYKVDSVALSHTGNNLLVAAVLHTPGTVDRRRAAGSGQIPGYTPRAGMEGEGAAGAFTPADGGGGGGTVDYDQVEIRFRSVLGLPQTVGAETLQHRIGGEADSYRQGLEDKAKSALIELLAPQFMPDGHTPNPEWTPQAGVYQDRLYNFVKNAAANPWSNVLGGQDKWGQDRKAELTKIVHDASHAP